MLYYDMVYYMFESASEVMCDPPHSRQDPAQHETDPTF